MNEERVGWLKIYLCNFAQSKVYYPSGKISQSPSFLLNKKEIKVEFVVVVF